MRFRRTFYITVTFGDKTYKPVTRQSHKAVSAFVNRKFSEFRAKYGDRADSELTIDYGYFDDSLNWVKAGVFHA